MIRKANLVNFVDTDRLVVAGTNKLFACGWVVDVNYSWDVVLVHAQRRGKISHVECIETWEWNKKEDFNISFKQKSNIKFYNYLKSSLATVKTKASIGFQQSELLLIFKTTFLIGEDSLISYKMTLRSLPQVARKIKREAINRMYYCWCCSWAIFFILPNMYSSTWLKRIFCKLSTPHWKVLIGEARECSHKWQTSPQVAIKGLERWWLTLVNMLLVTIVLMGVFISEPSGQSDFHCLISLSSPTV